MAIYKRDIVDINLETGNIFRSFLNHSIGSGDEKADRFGFRVFRNGAPETISGSCIGLFIRPDGGTVTIQGAVSGNLAYVELPEACYVVEGNFTLAIKLIGTNVAGTIRIIDGTVTKTSTAVLIDPGTVIPSIEDLIEAIDEAVAAIPVDYSALSDAVNLVYNSPKIIESTFSAKGQTLSLGYSVVAGYRYYIRIKTDTGSSRFNAYVANDYSYVVQLSYPNYYSFIPHTSGELKLFNFNEDASYIGDIEVEIEPRFIGNVVEGYVQYNTDEAWVSDYPSRKLADIPNNKIIIIAYNGISITDSPVNYFTGTVVTINDTANHDPGMIQFAVSFSGNVYYRAYSGAQPQWHEWKKSWNVANDGNPVAQYKQYITAEEWLAEFPSNLLADIPTNRIITIGSDNIQPLDRPGYFVGNVVTLTSGTTLRPGALQIATNISNNSIWVRHYRYSSSGNYWVNWSKIKFDETVYYVGANEDHTSLVSLLLDLQNDQTNKTIYIRSGTYNLFTEYMAEVNDARQRIQIPPDDVTSPDYFEPYNAFVPNNTKIIGLGDVVLEFTPDASDITYGASVTWSPLNIYGSCEIENITVKGHNCRYCLHNDDHNAYPNSKQVYRNVRFLYEYGDSKQVGSETKTLGFNCTTGFGIQAGSQHIYENCEFYMEAPVSEGTTYNRPAFYGHDANNSKDGSIVLKNCIIHSNIIGDIRLIRLQTLATSQGHVQTIFESCYINGQIELNAYYNNSPQNFDVTFVNSNKTVINRTPNTRTDVDPYTVRWFNPLPTPTDENPQYEEDSQE